MPPEIAAAFALELLAALAHANAAGVVHRDIKPENVLIEHRPAPSVPAERTTPAPSGDRVVVKLTDFGIAKLLDAQGVTSTGQVLGSPAHMAPEQIEGGEVDARADVFGMGVLLYECMVGHLPFEGNNPAQVLRRVLDGHYPEAQAERPVVGPALERASSTARSRTPRPTATPTPPRCTTRSSPSSSAWASPSPGASSRRGWTTRRRTRGRTRSA